MSCLYLKLSHKFKENTCEIVVKLDLTKVFDKIEWPLITYMLNRINFPPQIINPIHKFISFTYIAIKFNKQKIPYFKPSRGIK